MLKACRSSLPSCAGPDAHRLRAGCGLSHPRLSCPVRLGRILRHDSGVAGRAAGDSPTIGGFLYVALASIAAGLLLGAVRWLTLDRLHHATGVRVPRWNFGALQRNLAAFEGSVDNHLRYYQFYGHTLLAVLIAAAVRGPRVIHSPAEATVAASLLLPLIALLFVASRDALAKHYLRTSAILGTLSEPRARGVRSDDQRLASETRDRTHAA